MTLEIELIIKILSKLIIFLTIIILFFYGWYKLHIFLSTPLKYEK